jgi:thymidylate synthase (FAD)
MTVTIVEPRADLITPVSHLLDYSKLIELAARTCYKSEDKIGEGTDRRIIKMLIKKGHESVLEHCGITYKITCSRTCSHQLVRHRIAAFSQESMRYCDYSGTGLQVIVPPEISINGMEKEFLEACDRCYEDYRRYRSAGVKPEDARFILPNATKTEVVTTFNIRMWRHVLRQRWLNKHAQWEIRKVMNDIAYELNHYLPVFFEDIVEE